ncbi:MAG: hypothetical protein IPM64_11910 [Phycisphaerales bacterium]|nr:hypothetical protein [Phycisphaerales bacterium]
MTALLLGGCPAAEPQTNITTTASTGSSTQQPGRPTAVRYWVQADGGGLMLYRLPAERSATGDWFGLAGAPSWFTGDGLYEFVGETGWRRLDAGGLSLDDVIQTLDLRPDASFGA